MHDEYRLETLQESLADGFLDDEAGDEIGRIDDAFALALGGLRRRLTLRFCAHFFDIGDRLLEDMTEHADRNVA